MKHTIITRQAGTGGKHIPVLKALVKMKSNALICALLPLLLCCKQSFAQVGTWTPLTNTSPHYNEGEMFLLTDGRVLAKTSGGGSDPFGDTYDILTPDSHGSYVNGTWSSIAPMHESRLYYSTQVLPDGRVYVAGGEYGPGGNKCEVYTPSTNTWTTPLRLTNFQFRDANSELLPSGKVLQSTVIDTVDGTPYLSLSTFLYDPVAGTYTATANNTLGVDNESEWVKLPDSSILFCDRDLVTGLPTQTSERYIPSTNTWVLDAPLPVELYDTFGAEDGPAFLLPNGKVLFMGGASVTAIYTPSGNASPGTWSVGPAVPNGLGAPDASAAMMNNGKILFALSPAPYATDEVFTDPVYFYEYDYTTNRFTLVPDMFGFDSVGTNEDVYGTYITNMLDLPDGNVLFTFSGYDGYWIYTPTGRPMAAGKPTIDNIINTDCTTYKVTGKLFNGISEGASYGDDWQMNTNYPIIRLSSGSNVYYATTSNWNRIGAVMTGNSPDTAQFALPTGLPDGTYSVVLIANGNPSDPETITTSSHAISPSASTICVGRTIALTDAVGGGRWSSGSHDATIGASTGDVTAIAPGTVTISDSFGLCVAKATVTVIATPDPITGTLDICNGATSALSSFPTGGAWTSSNDHTAIGAATGIITGESGGNSTITYSLGGSCYTTAEALITPLPSVSLSGSVCAGSLLTMHCSPAYDSVVWAAGSTYLKTTASPTGPYNVVSVGTADGISGANGTFVDNHGNLYVTDYNNARVLEYPAGFTSATSGIVVAEADLLGTYSVFVDDTGGIYVGDEGYGGVIWYFPVGSGATGYGNPLGVTIGGYIGDIAVDHSGNIFAVDAVLGAVLEFPAGSTYPGTPVVVAEPGYGFDGFSADGVYGLSVTNDDVVYAADYNDNVIFKYNPLRGFGNYDGGTIVAGNNGAGSAANQFDGPQGVFVDRTGNIYVTDALNARVQKFPSGSTSATNGVTVAGQGGIGSGSMQLNDPAHSSVDAAGNIYVGDYYNNRVQVYYNVGRTSTTTTDTLTSSAGGVYSATVTDILGCSATATMIVEPAPTCSITVTPGTSVFTGGAPTTLYLGYGPSTATLDVTATGGTGFTYLWSSAGGTGSLSDTHIKNPIFTASWTGTYTYVCTVTNSNGCTTTCSVTMCVINAADPKIKDNVLLCNGSTTISMSSGLVAAYLYTHPTDHLGPCGVTCGESAGREAGEGGEQIVNELTVTAFPNPSNDNVHVKIQSTSADNVDVTVYDVTGRIMEAIPNQVIGPDIIVAGGLTPGVYFIEVRQGDESRKIKLVKY